jgi:hypothetical protein
MYRCQITGKNSKPGEPLNKVVAATRPREYIRKVKNDETLAWEDKVVGRGSEIVRELDLTQEGLALWDSWTPAERQAFLEHLDAR